MKKITGIAITAWLLALSHALPVSASGDMCTVSMDQCQPRETLQAELEAKGWRIKKIESDDGCYEVYAITENGKRVEAYFNPETFDLVKSKED